MKKVFIILASVCTLLSAVSCNEWLEATSSTRIQADKMFQTKSGFYDALSGIYINMGDRNAYGGFANFEFMDLAAYPYVYSSSTNKKNIQAHQYAANMVSRTIRASWTALYNCVSNVNLALEMLDIHSDVITDPNEYNMICGELHALRAYIHFDIMRIFGIGDLSGENASKITVPYVLSYDKEPTPQLSYSQTCNLMMADIDKALECLEQSDPVAGKISKEDMDSYNQEGYWTNRRKHLNYIAVLGLKARLFQWMGDLENAALSAQEAISVSGQQSFVNWIDPEELASSTGSLYFKDNTFSGEHIFSLEIAGLLNYALIIMAVNMSVAEGYIIPKDFVDDVLYQRVDPETGSLAGVEDIRGPLYWLGYTPLGYFCQKYNNELGSPSYNIFPMMKISEMYYIIAEAQIAGGRNADALSTLDEVRRHRGISDTFPATADAEEELMKEYYREFISEGQIPFWLKHKNVQSSLYGGFDLKASDLVLPYPDDEINYGRVQEK